MADKKRQTARLGALLLDNGRPVRIEHHRVLQGNTEALAKPEGHHDYLTEGHAEDVLFFRIIQVVIFEGPPLIDMLETCV